MELLERGPQLAALDDLLSAVRTSGVGRLVLVAGEAGVGKTALIDTFTERHPATPVLAGAAAPLFTPRPLGPLLDLLAGLDPDHASAAQAVAALAGAVRHTSVVVLEDLHWADEATVDALSMIGRRLATLRALVIITYREHELDRRHPLRLVLGEVTAADRLVLEPLSATAVARLATDGGVTATGLYERTAGNPFYVTELLAHGGSETPGSVRDAVLARAGRLPTAARRLLEAAAVARPRAEVWLLQRIAPEELASLETCLASGMLRAEGDAVAFRHEIARATIEDDLPPDRRVALHRAALEALAGRDDPARLAHHAEAAGDGPAVVEHATSAAERAARLGAHREAAAHYAAVLRHATGLDQREHTALLAHRSYACFLAGMIPESLAARQQALAEHRRAGDRLAEGDDERWLSRLAWYRGDGAGFRTSAARAVELLETLPPSPELVRAYTTRASPPMFDYDLAETREWGTKALRLAERLGEDQAVITALLHVGTVEFSHGLAEGEEKLRHSLRLALDAGLLDLVGVAYSNLVSSALYTRDYGKAVGYLDAGRAFCDEQDLRSWGSYLDAWGARVALDQGRWPEAASLVGQVFVRAPRSLPHSRFIALVVQGVLAARRGDESPWPALDEAREIARATGELQRLAPVAIARAEARWLAGTPELIPAEAEQAYALAERSEHAWTLGELISWQHRAGRDHPDPGLPLPAPIRAELAGDAETAAAFWTERGCTYEAAVVRGTSGAESTLRKGLRELQELGARPAAAIVARRLRERGARGVKLGPRAATRANSAGLTARQLDVLALMIKGARNSEIAAQLFLSEKTVSNHVSAVLLKLEVSNRGQAVAEAVRRGIDPNER
ncbi:ATP-binding protein [Microlunatus sp. GCM10028923]|uniref:ATP-binding protein n=1 Tax=Microlunatus sp. GCM10028923 TaxID=3273400 RepID=UPI00361EB01D